MPEKIKSFNEFYECYLTGYLNETSRILHFFDIFLVLILHFLAILNGWEWIFLSLVGYGFAWVGNAFFEKNKPATFKYPFWSLTSDFKLFFDILFGRKHFDSRKDQA